MLFWTVRKETKFCDIKSINIDEFYHSQVDFDVRSKEARRFEKICKILEVSLNEKPKLVGHYIIHLILLADSLLDEYVMGWEPHLANKLHEFDQRRRKASEANKSRLETEYERYYSEYGQLTQTRSDDGNTIRRRHAFFTQEMLNLLSPKKLDSKRSFSDVERKTVFFRDLELCQWCRMNERNHKVSWEECEIHHVTPYTDGGATSIDNAALVHQNCHPEANSDVERFRDWWDEPNRGRSEPGRDGQKKVNRSFPPPESTKAKFNYRGQVHMGEIQHGKLILNGSCEGICKSFSDASREVTGTSRNGWKDWYLLLPDEDAWVLANEWRNRTKALATVDF